MTGYSATDGVAGRSLVGRWWGGAATFGGEISGVRGVVAGGAEGGRVVVGSAAVVVTVAGETKDKSAVLSFFFPALFAALEASS
jgi:hypothetical protein